MQSVCAGEAVGSVNWYYRMSWAVVGILGAGFGEVCGLWMAGGMVEGYLARQ